MSKQKLTTEQEVKKPSLGVDFARHVANLKKENRQDIENLKQELTEKIDSAVANLENTAEEIISAVRELDFIKGEPGKEVDVKALEKSILSKVPVIDEEKIISEAVARVPVFDPIAVEKKILSKLPKNNLKVITQNVEIDPMSVVDKILSLPSDKLKLKTSNIDGLEQTLSAFRSQISSRGYVHGGGDTVAAGTNVTITTNSQGQKVISATGGVAGVTSFNTLTGAVTISAGSGITLTPVGNDISIASTGGGSGTVTSVSVVSANGVSGSVANATTTPAITLTLGAITPTTVNGITLIGASSPQLTVTGTASISGANTGDQTSVTGNAGTATALQNTRTIWGQNFNGTANVTGTLALGTADLTLTGSIGTTGARATKVWATDMEVTNAIVGSVTGNAGTATALQTARNINGVSFNGTGDITVTAAAGTLTGTTLNATIVTSSLTSLGTITSLVATSADINGGTIDGTSIGASSASTIRGTTIEATTSVTTVDDAYSSSWNANNTVPTKNAVYDTMEIALPQNTIRAIQALGSVIDSQTVGIDIINATTGQSLSDGTAHYMAVYIPKQTTITGVKWIQRTQGSYTADNNNYVALYSYSGGTMTRVAISTNNGNLWKGTANTIQSEAFTGTYDAAPGIYFVGFLYNNSAQTTAPTIGGVATGSAIPGLDLTNSAKLYGFVTSQTTLPATQAMSGVSEDNAHWVAVY